MKKIMVIGASGVLGNLVCRELLRIFESQIKLFVTDYKIQRGQELARSLNEDVEFRYIDVNEESSVRRAIKDMDGVVVVLGQNAPHIQRYCVEQRILCLDVTPFYDFVERVKELHPLAINHNAGSVVMSGFFPGLSGLMVKKAAANFEEVEEVHVGLLQNTNAKAGIAGILDMLKIIAAPVRWNHNTVPGFTEKRKMKFLNHPKAREVRLIEHAEKSLLKDGILGESPLYYWTSWNVPAFNKQVSFLRRTGFLNKLGKRTLSKIVKHNSSKSEHAFLTVEVKGVSGNTRSVKLLSLATFSDYHTTAMVTAALVKIAMRKNVKGVLCPFEITDLEELLVEVNCPDLEIKEVEV